MEKGSVNASEFDLFKSIYLSDESSAIPLFDDGFVKLIDCFPRIVPAGRTLEFRAVQSARVSYGRIVGDKEEVISKKSGKSITYTNGLKGKDEDRSLLKYLIRHSHTSPLESISFQFVIKIPIFVKNQIIRHRTGKFNEYSQRYNEVDLGFYNGEVRMQGNTHNQQSSDEDCPITAEAQQAWTNFIAHTNKTFELYNQVIASGIAREVAREHLPLSTFTILYFQMDLNNMLKFLRLRLGEGAQKEVRLVAEAIKKLITPLVPDAMAEFDNSFEGIHLSKNDINLLNSTGEFSNFIHNFEKSSAEYKGSASEKKELEDKLLKLG